MKNILTFSLLSISAFAFAQQSPFRYIIATDGTGTHSSIQGALDDCPDNERSILYIKNGVYAEKVSLGSKAVASKKLISLIGESMEGVIITSSDALNQNGITTFEDATTVQVYATDFYAENITFENAAGNKGQALALYSAGDRQVYNKVKMTGYQDTYRSKKTSRIYVKDSWIEGAVDFIYAGGTVFFDDCTINAVKGGGYICAPEDAVYAQRLSNGKFLRYGFVFRNCDLTANEDVLANSYYLGRPWQSISGTYYLNCQLGKHINPDGWRGWNGNESNVSFAEYQSRDFEGNLIDVSKRVSWSFQLDEQDVNEYLSHTFVYNKANPNLLFDPIPLCVAPEKPAWVNRLGASITWESSQDAIGYVVKKNNSYLASTNLNSFTDETATEADRYTVKSINANGNQSEASMEGTSSINTPQTTTLIQLINKEEVRFTESVKARLLTISGSLVFTKEACMFVKLEGLSQGIYLLEVTSAKNERQIKKVFVR